MQLYISLIGECQQIILVKVVGIDPDWYDSYVITFHRAVQIVVLHIRFALQSSKHVVFTSNASAQYIS